MSKKIVLSLKNISKSFQQGKNKLNILKKANFEISQGEVVGLIGPSGSGKSTFMQIAGLLDSADSGKIIINEQNCSKANDNMRTKIRRDNIGFIYQLHNLLPEFTALENVVIPQIISGKSSKEATVNAKEILKYLGLEKRISHRPSELSGGEQQRVAIARAVVNKPSLLLADEPTGNLDPQTSFEVFDLLTKTARAADIAMLIVTHDHALAKKMDRVVALDNGELI